MNGRINNGIAAAVLILSGGAAHADDDYVLVHAVGNNETLIARDMSRDDCIELKHKIILAGVIKVEGRTEDPTLGTLSCLPERFF